VIRIACANAIDIDRPGTVACAIGAHGGMPHAGVCSKCTHKDVRDEADFAKQETARLEKLLAIGGGCEDYRAGLRRIIDRLRSRSA
jgi:hypothetical protein